MTQAKSNNNVKLSTNVRKMKFMQRGLSEAEKKLLEESESNVSTSEHWELDLPPLGKTCSVFEKLEGHSFCLTLRHGHMSFGGYNRAIEKLMADIEAAKGSIVANTSDNSDCSISDEEMAERFSTLVDTVAKKYKTKNSLKESKVSRKAISTDRDDSPVPNKIAKTSPTQASKRFLKPPSD